MRIPTLAVVASLAACSDWATDKGGPDPDGVGWRDTAVEPDETPTDDVDGDGFSAPEDCDDADADVYPGADDAWYDGVDSDCAGDDDFDADGDGDPTSVGGGGDCDDRDPSRSSRRTELCGDPADHDCDGAGGCADTECVGLPACIEDCTSGADEDLDGLVDCEDADCSGVIGCREDCLADGDEDGDGVEGCADDDCFGEAPCPTVRLTVGGGSLVYQDSVYGWQKYVDVRGLSGTVAVRTSGLGTASCRFSGVHHRFEGTQRGGGHTFFVGNTPTGNVSGECGLALTSFTPGGLHYGLGYPGGAYWMSPWFLPERHQFEMWTTGWYGSRVWTGDRASRAYFTLGGTSLVFY